MKNLAKGTLTIVLLICVSAACYSQYNPKVSRKSKTIKLKSIETNPSVIYENSVSIIYMNKSSLVNQIGKHLDNKRLCSLRREKYTNILHQLLEIDSSFFIIEPTLSPEELRLFGIPDVNTKTGFEPLDYYASKLKKDISTDYIPPYGFHIEADTIGKIHLNKYFNWMISDLVLEGNAKVYNKESKEFVKRIVFEIVSFEGHGGESLLFPNGTTFFNVNIYSDIVMPDIECGDDYEEYEVIE